MRAALGKSTDRDVQFLLKEKVPHISKDGRVAHRDHRVSFADHFAFTLRTHFSALEINKDPFDDPGWDRFTKTLRVRDRITHPKLQSDVEITDDDLAVCEAGLSWFENVVVAMSRKDTWGLKKIDVLQLHFQRL